MSTMQVSLYHFIFFTAKLMDQQRVRSFVERRGKSVGYRTQHT